MTLAMTRRRLHCLQRLAGCSAVAEIEQRSLSKGPMMKACPVGVARLFGRSRSFLPFLPNRDAAQVTAAWTLVEHGAREGAIRRPCVATQQLGCGMEGGQEAVRLTEQTIPGFSVLELEWDGRELGLLTIGQLLQRAGQPLELLEELVGVLPGLLGALPGVVSLAGELLGQGDPGAAILEERGHPPSQYGWIPLALPQGLFDAGCLGVGDQSRHQANIRRNSTWRKEAVAELARRPCH